MVKQLKLNNDFYYCRPGKGALSSNTCWLLLGIYIIGPPKQDRKQSIKNKNNRSLSFHFDLFSGCRFVRFSGFSLISHELLDKTYIYTHHQNGLNEEIKIMCFVVSTYISFVINENVRKMVKTKTLNFKFMRQMIYHLVGHEILNITVYFIFHYNI